VTATVTAAGDAPLRAGGPLSASQATVPAASATNATTAMARALGPLRRLGLLGLS
jgi:hypothetical protein